MERRGWTTPVLRGRRAGRLRAEAVERLTAVLDAFAEERDEVLRNGSRGSVAFCPDVERLAGLSGCREWSAQACRRRRGLSRRDAEAAIVSVYCQVVATRHPRLFGVYENGIATRLRKSLEFRLDSVGVHLRSDDLREGVLRPMSRYFLESLRMLKSDLNRIAGRPDGEPLAVRPFGWAPHGDELDVFLSLLLVNQAKWRFLPEAFKYSPLAWWLRSEGLANIRGFVRLVCDGCAKEFPGLRPGTRCPECAGRIEPRGSFLLVATNPADEPLDAGADRDAVDPGLEAERRDLCERAREISRSRVRELWRRTVGAKNRGLRKSAVLLSLARIESLPPGGALRCPVPLALERVAHTLLECPVNGDAVGARARDLLRQMCLRGMCRAKPLSVTNTRAILSRFRDAVFGPAVRGGKTGDAGRFPRNAAGTRALCHP